MERALASAAGRVYGRPVAAAAAAADDGDATTGINVTAGGSSSSSSSNRRRSGGGGGGGGGGSAEDEQEDPSRVFSTSFFHPGRGHLAHYESYTMRAVDHKGFLDVQQDDVEEEEEEEGGGNGDGGGWHTRYCVLKDGALSIYKEPPLTPRGGEAAEAGDAPSVVIPLEHVASVKSAEPSSSSSGGGEKKEASARQGGGRTTKQNAFMIITPERAWVFRALARSDMQEWLFAFHRSLAVIVARLVDSSNNGLFGGLGGVGGSPRYGVGGMGGAPGGLLSSRNDTNLMAARRGPRFVDPHLGHGHGRVLTGAPPLRFRQVVAAPTITTDPSDIVAIAGSPPHTHGGILRGISPPTRQARVGGGAGVLRRGVVASADSWGGSPVGTGGSPVVVGVPPSVVLTAAAAGGVVRPPAMGSGQGGVLLREEGVGGLLSPLGFSGVSSPPPSVVPSAHAAPQQQQLPPLSFYSTTTPADYLLLSSASQGLQTGTGQEDVVSSPAAEALAAMAARFSPQSSTASARSSSLAMDAHTHLQATLSPTTSPGLTLDVVQARRARAAPAAGAGQTPGGTPSTGEGASFSSPLGGSNGQQQGVGNEDFTTAMAAAASPRGYYPGCGVPDDGPGLMFEMSMDEVLDAGVSGLRLAQASPRPQTLLLSEQYIGTVPLVETAGGGLINVRVEEGSGGGGGAYRHPHHPSRQGEEEEPAAAAAAATGAFPVEEDGGGVSPNGRRRLRRPRPAAAPGEGEGEVPRELGWTFGVISLQGIRKNQEDQYTAIPDLAAVMDLSSSHSKLLQPPSLAAMEGEGEGGEDTATAVALEEAQAFYAVYDGHCGVRAARYARELMHHYLVQEPLFHASPGQAMTGACRRVDREVLEICERESLYCGTTAIMALIRGRKITVGNLGDGAAVLCRRGQAVPLSTAQTPGRPDETARIERANGWVTEERELFVGRLHRMDLQDPSIAQAAEKRVQWVTIHRVCGELSVSRSIGDPDFKGFTAANANANASAAAANAQQQAMAADDDEGAREERGVEADFPFAFPAGHSGAFVEDLVIADPEIMEMEIGPQDAFLLLACDGFWDVMDAQEAVDCAQGFLGSGLSAPDAAAQLGNLALRFGSADNVTCLLVVFDHGGDNDGGEGEGMVEGGEEEAAMR